MKKFTCLLIAALIAASILSGCSKGDPTVPDGMKLASDPAVADYTFFVPEDWDVDMRTASTRAYCPGGDKSYIMVMTGDLGSTGTTVADWWESGLSELEALYRDFKLVSRESTTLDGTAAEKFVYSGTFDGTEFKYTQTAAVKSTSIYVITYGAEAEKWADHSDEADAAVAAFRFGK